MRYRKAGLPDASDREMGALGVWIDGGGDCGGGGAESLKALRGMITLKEVSVLSGFQWGQWFGGRAD